MSPTLNFEPLERNAKDIEGFAAANGFAYASYQSGQPYTEPKGSLFNTGLGSSIYTRKIRAHERFTGSFDGKSFEMGTFDFYLHVVLSRYRMRFRFSYLKVTLPVSLPRLAIDEHRSSFETAKAYAMRNFPWYKSPQLPPILQMKHDPDYQPVINEVAPHPLLAFLLTAGRPFSVEVIDNELYIYMYGKPQPQFMRTLFEALRYIDLQHLADLDKRITRTVQTPYTRDPFLSRFVPARKSYAWKWALTRFLLPLAAGMMLAFLLTR